MNYQKSSKRFFQKRLLAVLLAGGLSVCSFCVLPTSALGDPYELTDNLSETVADLVAKTDYSGGITNSGATTYTLTVTGGVDIGDGSTPYAQAISGNLNLVRNGGNYLHLSVPNTYTGTTTITGGGGIVLRGSGTLGTGTLTVDNGYLHSGNLSTGTLSLSNDILLGSGGLFFYPGWSKTIKVTGNVSDVSGKAGKITVIADSGKVLLQPAAGKSLTYTGGTTVNSGGHLELGAANVLPTAGTVSVNGTGYIEFNGYNQTINNYSGTGILQNSSETAITLSVSADQTASETTTFNGSFKGASGAITVEKNGAGKLVLGGSGTVDKTSLVVNGGSVELGNTGADTGFTGLTINSGSETAINSVKITGTNSSILNGSVSMGNYASLDLNGVSQSIGNLNNSGTRDIPDRFCATGNTQSLVTNTSTTAATLTITASETCVYDGKLSGNLNLVLGGSGDYLYLNNANNDYTGTFTVTGGRTLIPAVGAVTGTLILNKGGLHNGNRTATYSNNIQIGAESGWIKAGWSKNITLTGSISDLSDATGNLLIHGDSGTVVLAPSSGKSNTYTGGTTVNSGGRLELGAANALPTTGDVKISGTGYLNLAGNAASIGLLNGDGVLKNTKATGTTLTIGAGTTADEKGTFTGTISGVSGGTIQLVKTGEGTQIIGGGSVNGFVNLKVSAGTVELAKTAGAITGVGTVEITGGTLKLTGASTNLINETVTQSGGKFDLNGKNWTDTTSGSQTIKISNGTIANSNTEALSTVTFTQNNSSYQTTKVAFSGNLKVVKDGSGNLGFLGHSPDFSGDVQLKTNHTYIQYNDSLGTGTITIDGGNLLNFSSSPVVSNDIVLNSTSGGLRVGFGSGYTMTVNGTISGNQNLRLNVGESNGGSITLNAANTYTGSTEIYGTNASVSPTYTAGNDKAFSGGAINFHENANLCLNAVSSDRVLTNGIGISANKTVTVKKTGTNRAILASESFNGQTGSALVLSSGTILAGAGVLDSLTFLDGSDFQVNMDNWLTADPGVLKVNNLTFEGDAKIQFVATDYMGLKDKRINFLEASVDDLESLFDFSQVGGLKSWSYGVENGVVWASVDGAKVPEPSSVVLLLVGLFGLGYWRRKR